MISSEIPEKIFFCKSDPTALTRLRPYYTPFEKIFLSDLGTGPKNIWAKFGPFCLFPVGATGVNERTSERANELKRKNITSA
jgi:hypothetical protein